MKLKKIVNILLIFTFVITLTSCNIAKDPVKNVDNKLDKENKEELEGKIIIWSKSNIDKNIKVSADKFRKENPKVQFEFVELKPEEMNNKINNALKMKDNLPDIVVMDSLLTPVMIKRFPDGFANVSDEFNSLKDKFLKYRIDSVTVEDKVYGFPYESKPIGVFYRKDIFNESGIKIDNIKTWNDYIEAGKNINNKTSGNTKLICFSEDKDDLMYRQLMNQLGVFFFNKEGKPVINDKESVKVVSIMKKMHDSGVVYNGDENIVNLVKNNKVASVIYSSEWSKVLKDECDEQNGKWGFMRLPAFEPGGKTSATIGGENLLIIKKADNEKLSAKFAKYVAEDKETLVNGFVNYGIYPSLKTCYADEVFEKSIEYFGGQEVWKLYYEIDREAIYTGYTEDYFKVKEDIIKAQENILIKNESENDILFNLQRDFETKLKK